MATAKKNRIKKTASPVSVPQNREQVADAIRELGLLQRDLARIEADMNDELAQVKAVYEEDAEPRRQRAEVLVAGVQIWSEANREALTQGDKVKTAAFTTGKVAWRMRPKSVRITGQDSVLEQLRSLGLKRFIREKEEVNKEAILNEPEAVAHVAGIAISQGEDFVVTPFEVELGGVAA